MLYIHLRLTINVCMYLLYKAEKPSVRPHFVRIFVSRGSRPSVHVLASNLLEKKRPSSGVTKFYFLKFLIVKE